MSAKILVVDDIPANVRVLEARLQASYYSVVTASSGAEALDVAAAERPDLILLDVMMPEMDGFECCRRLKSDPALASIPVVMVTALDQASDRLKGLEAGADDFLTKPPNETALFARVRSLVRVKMMIDELRLRDETLRDFGAGDDATHDQLCVRGSRIVVVDPRESRAQAMADLLANRLEAAVDIAANGDQTIALAQRAPADAYVIAGRIGAAGVDQEDGLALCGRLRSRAETRRSGLLLTIDEGDHDRIAAALDIGVDDYILRPVDEAELVARMRAQLRRKHFAERLRRNMRSGLQMAMTDELTGLYNRRYADQHLNRQVAERARSAAPMALMVLDIDHFKMVNDTYGHPVGDEVLVEFAQRMRDEMRGVDLLARYGGEEFVAALPEARGETALRAADRLRAAIAGEPFDTSAGLLTVTASIGVATLEPDETAPSLLRRADEALYAAKRSGRNRVATAAGAIPGVAPRRDKAATPPAFGGENGLGAAAETRPTPRSQPLFKGKGKGKTRLFT